jgi:Ca2+/Na+ antiporter
MESLFVLLGMAFGSVFAIGFIALVLNGVVKRLQRSTKDSLLISCVIAVFVAVLLSIYFQKRLDLVYLLASLVGGLCAFGILRRRFRREAEEDESGNELSKQIKPSLQSQDVDIAPPLSSFISEVTKCPACHAENPGRWKYCPDCGVLQKSK